MQVAEYFALLDRTTAETLEVARAIPPGEWLRAAEGRWSALEVLEHCCILEALVLALAHRPSAEHHDAAEVHGSSKLHHLIVNKRDHKIVAPERVHPKGVFKTEAEFEDRFLEQRQALKDALEGGTVTIDNRLFPHPVLGNMTITDWLYFLVHHTERHVLQLKETYLIPTA